MAIKKTTSEFTIEAGIKHNNLYDYSSTIYDGARKKITIICKKHGEFTQLARAHLDGQGCVKCTQRKNWTPKSNLATFIRRSIEIHGDRYDYSNVNYTTCMSKVDIICKEHGRFTQKANGHLNGQGCPKCSKNQLKSTSTFIEEAVAKHGDIYNYTKSEYISSLIKIIIICKTHGEFKQIPSRHLRGHGCEKCGNRQLSQQEFIEESIILFNDRYSYENTIYYGSGEKVNVKCDIHGEFQVTAQYHLQGGGCPKCAIKLSKEHRALIDFIQSIYTKEILMNDRKAIKPYELDIYLPDTKLAIELNGIYYHSYNRQETTIEKRKHSFKHNLCIESGIKLLQFTDYEWNKKRELVKSMISNNLNLSKKINARQCELTNSVPNDFFRNNHINGFKPACHTIGLEFQNEIVCAISFSKHDVYDYEVCRLATKIGVTVNGGASKMLKAFVRTFKPKSIFTYADRRFSIGNVYYKLGFMNIGVTNPNYSYVDRNKVDSRLKFQKHKLESVLSTFDKALTESQNMFNNGYRRLWDAGHYKFLLVS